MVVSVEDTRTEHGTVTVSTIVDRLGIGQIVNVVQLGALLCVVSGKGINDKSSVLHLLHLSTHPATSTFT